MSITIKSRLLTHADHPLLPPISKKDWLNSSLASQQAQGSLKLSYDLSQDPYAPHGRLKQPGRQQALGEKNLVSVRRIVC